MTKTERTELSPAAKERITRVVRSLIDDHIERGVDLTRPMRCSSCDQEKSPLGATQYGAYQLCNDCLLDFTFALARGDVDNIAEYMTRRPEGKPPDHSDSDQPIPLATRIKRSEQLRPSEEPC